jgi:hypothetical protein
MVFLEKERGNEMFSKQVIVDIVKTLPSYHNTLDMYLIQFDLDDKISFNTGDSIETKKLKIVKYLIVNQDVKDSFQNLIVLNIVKDRITFLMDRSYGDFDRRNKEFSTYPNLYKYLRYDGFDIDIRNSKLVRTLPQDINVSEKEDNIRCILNKYNFSTTIGHYDQAKGSYLSDNYAAVNSQIRPYVESLFMEMANYIKSIESTNLNIASITPSNAVGGMQILVKCNKPIFDVDLNEWDGQSKGFIEAFWKRLHPQGSHPGLPTIDEAVFRFQLVILVTSNIINRFNVLY